MSHINKNRHIVSTQRGDLRIVKHLIIMVKITKL